MIKKIIIILILIFNILNANTVDNAYIENIIMKVASSGHLDKQSHISLWNELNKLGKKEAKETAIDIKNNLFPARELQLEQFKSAILSYEKRKVVKTKALIELRTTTRNHLIKSMNLRRNTKEYVEVLKVYDKRVEKAKRNCNRFLTASANHSIYTAANGNQVQITKEFLTNIVNNMDNSFQALNNLFNPNWS